MRDVRMTALIGRSINRTQEVLFRPFSARKWVALLFIAWLAGALSGGNGGGGGGGPDGSPQARQRQAAVRTQAPADAQPQAAPGRSAEEGFRDAAAFVKSPRGAAIVGTVTALALVFFLFWIWLSSRFKFIWFDAVIRNSAAVSEPYRRFKDQGNSLFGATVVLTLAGAAVLAGCGAWVYAAGAQGGAWEAGFRWSWAAAWGLFAAPIVVIGLWLLAGLAVYIAVDHFVVPVMGMNRVSFLSGCGQFFGIFGPRPLEFVLYCFVLLGLGILTGAIGLAAMLLALLVFGLAGAAVFGLLYFLVATLLKLKWLFAVLAVALGVPFGLLALFVMFGIGLVMAVFFRSFSLYFLLSQKSPLLAGSFEEYASKNPPGGPAPFPAAPMLALVLAALVFAGAIVAAVAIPAFAQARQSAPAARPSI